MKETFLYIISITFIFTSCKNKPNYFEPKGMINRTEEFKAKLEWKALNNKESVDKYTRIGDSIFGGEIACNIKPLSGIDIKSFRVLAGTKYAKDINNVYYPIEINCVDYEDCGVCYFENIIVKHANSKTFKYLGNDYATDGNNIFFRGKLIQNADAASFKVIDGPEYFYFATDKANVYIHNRILQNIDAETFYYDKLDKRNISDKYGSVFIIGDKNKEWEFIPPNSIKEVEKN